MATYNQPSFQDYRNQISIIELALHSGYEWQPKKGKTMPVLYHAGYNDHIVVKNPNDSANQVYFQTGSYTDRGTLINFVSNRLTACFSRFNNPVRSPAQCVNDVLKDYLGIVPEQKKSVKKLEDYIHQSFRAVGTEKAFAAEHFKLSQLAPQNYLTQERYIHPDLLIGSQFLGTVATQRVYFAEGIPVYISGTEQSPKGEKIIENIAFPYLPADGEAINGLEQRNANGLKLHAAGSSRGHGVWISNPTETDSKRIVVGESAIDMLSFRQLEISTGLHEAADSRYASIGGSLSLDHLTTLARFMDRSTQLVLGFDNDDKGARYALTALTALSKDGLSMVQASQSGQVALQVPSPGLQSRFTQIIAEHDATLQAYMPTASGELREDIAQIMFRWREKASVKTLEIPLKTVLLNAVNRVLLEEGQFSCSVSIIRPRGKDFNDDLKQELLRQVKRPLLLIHADRNQIVLRAKDEETARLAIEKELKANGKLTGLPTGTELKLVKSSPHKLIPVLQGTIRFTTGGIEKNYTEQFKTVASRQRLQPTNERSM